MSPQSTDSAHTTAIFIHSSETISSEVTISTPVPWKASTIEPIAAESPPELLAVPLQFVEQFLGLRLGEPHVCQQLEQAGEGGDPFQATQVSQPGRQPLRILIRRLKQRGQPTPGRLGQLLALHRLGSRAFHLLRPAARTRRVSAARCPGE